MCDPRWQMGLCALAWQCVPQSAPGQDAASLSSTATASVSLSASSAPTAAPPATAAIAIVAPSRDAAAPVASAMWVEDDQSPCETDAECTSTQRGSCCQICDSYVPSPISVTRKSELDARCARVHCSTPPGVSYQCTGLPPTKVRVFCDSNNRCAAQ